MTTWPMRLVRWYAATGRRGGSLDRDGIEYLRTRIDRWMGAPPLARRTVVDPVVGDICAEWVATPGSSLARTILYLHGGAYVAGSLRSHRPLVSRLSAASGARALSLDYRLAPEHPFPAAVDDAVAAYRWLLHCCTEPGSLVVAGDSAGGGLAVALAMALRDAGDPLPAGLLLIAPWPDLTETATVFGDVAGADPLLDPDGLRGAARAYLGGADSRLPLASPRWGDLGGLPPVLIQVGDRDLLAEDDRGLAAALQAAGTPVTLDIWKGMPHVWHATAPFSGAARRAIAQAGAWMAGRTP